MFHLKLNSCREHDPPYINFPYLVLFLRWRWVVPPSSMFSSILPNASSTAKFVQNGHPKVSQLLDSVLSLMKSISQNPSRFSVRVFRTPAASSYSYPTATKVDLGYRSVQQSEQQRYVPRYTSSSSIYYGAHWKFGTQTSIVITSLMTLGHGPTITLFILEL